ncbi:MAG: saccharopine dehydrogenase NADP-binding domain-containing protein [Woeseiaceae bacterium]|nr:saccharopine dehydrogenase NADP-binding domain-containing protein [Woeseiaceae bacterium]
MSPPANHRDLDLVVYGASGFTGRLVVEYLAGKYRCGESLRWAVAGRNREKLESVIAETSGSAPRPEILIADSSDAASLATLAGKTRVVLSTVGPYAKYGSNLVAACVTNGTHYCDLAGEAQWIRQMIDTHHDDAVNSGAMIVNSCGFDSIPSDIGVYRLQNEARAKYGEPLREIVLLVRAIKGGASGGTIASMLNLMEEAEKDRQIARTVADPYCLNPREKRAGPDARDQRGIEFCELAGAWTAPFVMAAINTRIVRRSNALLDYAYGEEFRYREAVSTGRGARGWLKAATTTAGLAVFMTAASSATLRRHVLSRLLPAPGEGPGREQRESGFFDLRLYGEARNGEILCLRVTGDRDPGYGSTSKMLSESAVCLALDEHEVGGGFWTPAAGMGRLLENRLTANAGLTFERVS